MRKYLHMFITHLQMPAAARDLLRISSGLKPGIQRRFLSTHATHCSATLSLSKFCNCCRNRSTLCIRVFFRLFQLRSFGIRPPGAIRTKTAFPTSTISLGGVAKAFSSVRLFLSKVLRARSASCMMGSAMASSSKHWRCMSATSDAMDMLLASFSIANARCSSTTAVSLPICSKSASVLSCRICTTCSSSFRVACSSATTSSVARNLSSPDSSRIRKAAMSWRRCFSIALYREISSRKLFGVMYTGLLSAWRYCTAAVPTEVCTKAMCCATSSFMSPSTNRCATAMRASLLHSWNQSITVQLIIAGKRRARTRNLSPTGLKHKRTCKLRRTLLRKKSQQLSRVSTMPTCFASDRTLPAMESRSSGAKRPAM
mmetsp:Transcript_17097/g.28225  ORF Transcript_17097/g.28225 Transcript_17097/m.28225 type:complete len:371 (+) Transcript_17097:561-1673(+)